MISRKEQNVREATIQANKYFRCKNNADINTIQLQLKG